MRPALLFPVLCGLAILLAGCPNKKGDASDAAADAGAVDATIAAAPEAANSEAIAHFPDETAIDHQAATLQWAKNNARKAPPSGEIIATLAKGTSVVQIATHDKYMLITFDNPKNPSERLMGWVIKDAFNPPGAVVPRGPCPPGQTQLLGDEIFCGKVCKLDTECPAGQACTGTAQTVLRDGGGGGTVKDCSAIVRPAGSDAGAPVATDAGAPVSTDSGAPGVADAGPPATTDAGASKDAGGGGATTDAGGGGGGGGGGAMVVEPGAGGTCPAGYKMGQPDGKCHHTCTPGKDGDCSVFGPGVFCTRGGYCKMR